MRRPSNELADQLNRLRLCTPAQLAGCESIVRRLCHDLPDFDSVWLDALVQRRVLSPFQAEVLQSARPEDLRVGRYVVVQPLGKRSLLAADDSGGRFVLRQLCGASFGNSPPLVCREEVLARLQVIIAATGAVKSATAGMLAMPLEVIAEPEAGQAFLVSRFQGDWSLEELLIRGGRLPAAAVAEIGRDLLLALTGLEREKLLHGEVVLRNVRLTVDGRIVVTAPFVRCLLQPHVLLTEELTLRDCEGVAPELTGSGRAADARSELYATGCLLWQLLTCRPIFLAADPVTRLMMMTDQDIPDVRGLVPDCPEWMARLILAMTRRSAELRPSSIAEVLRTWKASAPGGYAGTRRVVQQLPDHRRTRLSPVNPSQTRGLTGKISFAVACTVMLVCGGRYVGLLPRTLPLQTWLAAQAESSLPAEPAADAETAEDVTRRDLSREDGRDDGQPRDAQQSGMDAAGLMPLPAVDASGGVRLVPGYRYLASDIRQQGHLHVYADHDSAANDAPQSAARSPAADDASVHPHPQAVVVVPAGSEWKLTASRVRLTDVGVVPGEGAASPEPGTAAPDVKPPYGSRSDRALVRITSAALGIEHCVFGQRAAGDPPSAAGRIRSYCLAYHQPAHAPGLVSIRNSIMAGCRCGIRLDAPPTRCQLTNVLFTNPDAALRLTGDQAESCVWNLVLERVTQRWGQSVCDLVVKNPRASTVVLRMVCGESVLAPRQAIVRAVVPPGWSPAKLGCEFLLPETGNPAVVPPGLHPFICYDADLRSFVALPEQQVVCDSLLIADLRFRGNAPHEAPDASDSASAPSALNVPATESELVDFEGPRLTAEMPGIKAALLP